MEEILKIPKISEIKIEDYGIIKRANIEFKDGLNIIAGPNASGKTTVINFLKEKYNSSNLPNSEKMMLHIDGLLGLNQTILMDDVLSRLNRENLIETLNKLSNSGKRIILTLKDYTDISEVNANIIKTKNFELKQ